MDNRDSLETLDGWIGFTIGLAGLVAGCFAAALISRQWALNGLWQAVLASALGGGMCYAPVRLWTTYAPERFKRARR